MAGRIWWSVRCFMYRIAEHRYFDTFIIFMILGSSISLVRSLAEVHTLHRYGGSSSAMKSQVNFINVSLCKSHNYKNIQF